MCPLKFCQFHLSNNSCADKILFGQLAGIQKSCLRWNLCFFFSFWLLTLTPSRCMCYQCCTLNQMNILLLQPSAFLTNYLFSQCVRFMYNGVNPETVWLQQKGTSLLGWDSSKCTHYPNRVSCVVDGIEDPVSSNESENLTLVNF